MAKIGILISLPLIQLYNNVLMCLEENTAGAKGKKAASLFWVPHLKHLRRVSFTSYEFPSQI